jgi:hypothetical protein
MEDSSQASTAHSTNKKKRRQPLVEILLESDCIATSHCKQHQAKVSMLLSLSMRHAHQALTNNKEAPAEEWSCCLYNFQLKL